MNNSSVVITHYNRELNLRNTLIGLNKQSVPPAEVIVVNLGSDIDLPKNLDYPIALMTYPEEWTLMPIAAARNLGAKYADNKNFIFLDVDCIPSEGFYQTMEADLNSTNGLVMGLPRYMLGKTVDCLPWDMLLSRSVLHPARPKVCSLRKETCYELFWSLCFGISKTSYERIGGFDENFVGYGGEDTDFAKTAEQLSIPFFLNAAVVYHQQHPIYVPPLNHLEAIVANSNYYYSKWGEWPMQDCLTDFTNMAYIHWNAKHCSRIEIRKLPSQEKIREHLIPNAPYR
ncbi:MAG: glycosyltransferase [Maribacter sp.]